MTEVLPRRGSRSVDTRLTASTVGIEVAFSSLSVGVPAQGECRFERTVISDGGGASVGVESLGLPNLRKKGLPQPLAGLLRKGLVCEPAEGIEVGC